jgi:hypothetical protein
MGFLTSFSKILTGFYKVIKAAKISQTAEINGKEAEIMEINSQNASFL